MERSNSFIPGRKETLSDLVRGDILYHQKDENGYTVTRELGFERIERGMIQGIVLRTSWNSNGWELRDTGTEVLVSPRKCYLWGTAKGKGKRAMCHWLKRTSK